MTAAPVLLTPIPAGLDRDGLLDWIDAGSRERAEAVLAVQETLPPSKRDARLVVDLTAWLNGATVDDPAQHGEAVDKHPSTYARELEMYEADLRQWELENPGASRTLEAGSTPDDPGADE